MQNNDNFNLQDLINSPIQNEQQSEIDRQKNYIEQVKWKVAKINNTKEDKIKEFEEMMKIIKFEYKSRIEKELERINSKIDSVNSKFELEDVVGVCSELEKKVDECVFIVDRSIANVLEITDDLFSNGEIQQEKFLLIKDYLGEEIDLLNGIIENLKIYVEYAKQIFKNYEYIADTLESVKESSIKYKSYMDNINAGLKKLLSKTLGVFRSQITASMNNRISEKYYEARRDLAYFLLENIEPENIKDFKKKVIYSNLM